MVYCSDPVQNHKDPLIRAFQTGAVATVGPFYQTAQNGDLVRKTTKNFLPDQQDWEFGKKICRKFLPD